MSVAGIATNDRVTTATPTSFRRLALPVVFVVANVAILFGYRVPHENEYVYLIRLEVLQDPRFLANDWTFTRSFNEHFVFNTLFSPLTNVASIEVIGWVGRIVCWFALAILVLKVAEQVGARAWPAALALTVWIACQYRLVGEDWVFGTFEAKPLAYIALFGGLLLALRERVPLAMLVTGLALSLHPGVGIWGSLPLACAMIWWSPTRTAALRWWWLGALAAAPGVITVAGLGGISASPRTWEFVVDHLFPFHLDPFYLGAFNYLLLPAMLAFNLLYARSRARPSDALLVPLQILMALPVAGGTVAYLVGQDELLKFVPFRVGPVFISLLFFFNLADAWQRRRELKSSRIGGQPAVAVLLVMVVATLLIWNPPKAYAYRVRALYRDWTTQDTDADRALQWVESHVPGDAVVLLPPGPQDTYYLARRAQIVNSKAVSWDDIGEWLARLRAVAPGFEDLDIVDSRSEGGLEPLYEKLSEEEILELRDRFGVSYVVSPTDYDFTVLHQDADWRVYELSAG